MKRENAKENIDSHIYSTSNLSPVFIVFYFDAQIYSFFLCFFCTKLSIRYFRFELLVLVHLLFKQMGNSETRTKRGKNLSDADVTELSNLSGFTPQQVREWHSGFLVSR